MGERLWNEAGTGYLPGSNKVKVWGGRSYFLLLDFCACVEIR